MNCRLKAAANQGSSLSCLWSHTMPILTTFFYIRILFEDSKQNDVAAVGLDTVATKP